MESGKLNPKTQYTNQTLTQIAASNHIYGLSYKQTLQYSNSKKNNVAMYCNYQQGRYLEVQTK